MLTIFMDPSLLMLVLQGSGRSQLAHVATLQGSVRSVGRRWGTGPKVRSERWSESGQRVVSPLPGVY